MTFSGLLNLLPRIQMLLRWMLEWLLHAVGPTGPWQVTHLEGSLTGRVGTDGVAFQWEDTAYLLSRFFPCHL